MAFEDISGTRHLWSDYIGAGVGYAAASGTMINGARGFVMQHPFTIIGAGVGAGTTAPAGTAMTLKFWVNGARKGLGTVKLTSGAGSKSNMGSGYVFTGPANSVVDVSCNDFTGATAGVGARYDIRYVHGWTA